VVVATNPLFPQTAIEQRLLWAGVSVSEYEYALVTTMENMHATKPNESYYQEIADHLKLAPEEMLMVGDSWEYDIFPASALGMKTFWIPPDDQPAEDESLLLGSGSLAVFYEQLQNGLL
jgi:ribonucleotide monophosphatase NagD (HAD superfamily)